MGRSFAERADLASVITATFGAGRRLTGLDRLRGASKKGVYRLTLDDSSTAILYLWDEAENYWPRPAGRAGHDHTDPFAEASGADLFEASHATLTAIGVRTPRVYLADRSRNVYPADFAVVEDVGGPSLETLLRRDSPGAGPALAELGAFLDSMRRQHGRFLGKVAMAGRNDSPGRPCERIVLDRALVHLAHAADRVPRIAAARGGLADMVRGLAAAVPPRDQLSLVHGELGPDHVLTDRAGRPVLIDIEGVMFFDAEWEHAFLRLRFGEHYRRLRTGGLDEHRLRFYTLAMHLSLVAGPLALLDGDFPDRQAMADIAAYNTERALAFLR